MNKKKIIFISILFIILIIVIFIKKFNKSDEDYNQMTFNDVVGESAENKITEEKVEEKIKVHITGEVKNPGLIELNVGDRIYDAIELAGGLTNEADTSKTNLAYILSDGEKIYIPNINDEEIITSNEENSKNNKININTANASELETIPGIGEATANSIIEYRSKNRKI